MSRQFGFGSNRLCVRALQSIRSARRAAESAIILMVAGTRKGKVCGKAQRGESVAATRFRRERPDLAARSDFSSIRAPMWNNLPVSLAATHDVFLAACAAATVLLLLLLIARLRLRPERK